MYYPKSQITPNLYTNGGEFVYADTKEAYSGYYFKYQQVNILLVKTKMIDPT